MDGYVGAVADILGEPLPDRIFIRYEWIDIDHGRTFAEGDLRIVRDGRLLGEHELVHAVHREVWPASRPFFHEGLAVLLDNADWVGGPWPGGTPLEPLLEADRAEDLSYHQAWFLVSQVVRDHGFDGLGELWHAVPSTATAVEIREAYEGLFGQPIDALLQPDVMLPGTDAEFEVPRGTCHFTVCVGAATPWDGDQWSGEAAVGCEGDPEAVGPTPINFAAPVWRSYVVDVADGPHRWTTSAGVGAYVRPCQLRCTADPDQGFTIVGPGETREIDTSAWSGRVRVEVGRELEQLPTDEVGTLRIERL